MSARRFVPIWLALASVVGSDAPALTQPGVVSPPDQITVPEFTVPADRLDPASRAPAEQAMDDFARARGGHWNVVSWAPVSHTPGLALGSGYELGGPIFDAAEAEAAARGFVAAHPALFGIDVSRLGQARVRFGLGKWSVIWRESVDGLPILHSRVFLLLDRSGRLAAFGATTYPSIEHAPAPVIAPDRAIHLARVHLAQTAGIGLDEAPTRHEVRGPFVLPVISGRTVLRVSLGFDHVPAAFEVDVDAVTGEIRQRVNVLRHDYDGVAGGSVETPGWCSGFSDRPTAHLRVTVTHAGSDTTDLDGRFHIGSSGAEPETLRAYLDGAFADVRNLAGPRASLEGVITPGIPFPIRWGDLNSLPEERDTFLHANAIHDQIRRIDPTWTDMDFAVLLKENYAAGCNAFWDGSSVTLYRAQDGCANTGRLGDVVIHEYTHGVTDYMYGDDDPRGDVHEGNSDVAGNFMVDSPAVGAGFYLDDCVNGIRNSDNDLRWPEDGQGEIHQAGQILAGFYWHTRQALIAELGQDAGADTAWRIWHFSRLLGLPQMQPEQVWWSFLADDDDANMDNGTPHFAALAQAAERHGFAVPETFEDVVIHHTPRPCIVVPGGDPIPIEATLYSFSGPLDPDSLLVYYRLAGNGAYSSASFLPTGVENQYRALIPNGWPGGTDLDYWILARDTEGNRLRRPADGVYNLVVGLVCDDFEQVSGWTVGAPGDYYPAGRWVRCDPIGRYSVLYGWTQPEYDTTPDPGRLCWITGQDDDVAGRTTLVSPVFDLTGMRWAEFRYQQWFQTTNQARGVLEIWASYDGGANWTTIDHLEGYHGPASWTPRALRLDPPGGSFGPTQLRVVMFGMPGSSTDEGGLDDFGLLASDQDPSGAPDAGEEQVPGVALWVRSATGGIAASGAAAFEVVLPESGPMSLQLYHVDGSLVRVLMQEDAPAGRHQVSWDGRDAHGRTAASGVYFARLSARGGTAERKIVVAR
jgi:hypothetical protein